MAIDFLGDDEGCFDGGGSGFGGSNWSVSYDSGASFESVDFESFQNTVNNEVVTGPSPDGDLVPLGAQATTVVSTGNGADAIVSVGTSAIKSFFNSITGTNPVDPTAASITQAVTQTVSTTVQNATAQTVTNDVGAKVIDTVKSNPLLIFNPAALALTVASGLAKDAVTTQVQNAAATVPGADPQIVSTVSSIVNFISNPTAALTQYATREINNQIQNSQADPITGLPTSGTGLSLSSVVNAISNPTAAVTEIVTREINTAVQNATVTSPTADTQVSNLFSRFVSAVTGSQSTTVGTQDPSIQTLNSTLSLQNVSIPALTVTAGASELKLDAAALAASIQSITLPTVNAQDAAVQILNNTRSLQNTSIPAVTSTAGLSEIVPTTTAADTKIAATTSSVVNAAIGNIPVFLFEEPFVRQVAPPAITVGLPGTAATGNAVTTNTNTTTLTPAQQNSNPQVSRPIAVTRATALSATRVLPEQDPLVGGTGGGGAGGGEGSIRLLPSLTTPEVSLPELPIVLLGADIQITDIQRELADIQAQFNAIPAAQIPELSIVQELNQVVNTPQSIQTSVSTALSDYFGIENPNGQSAIDRAVQLALNQIPGVSEINRVAGVVRTVTDAGTTLSSDQLTAQEAVRATLTVIALANPAVGVLLRGLELTGVFGGPTLSERITTLSNTATQALGQPTGPSGGGGGGGGDAFVDLFDRDLAVDDDPYVSTGTLNDTSIRVLPEDLFVEMEGGLNVLREEQEGNVENTLPEPVDPDNTGYYPNGLPYDDDGNLNPGWAINPETGEPYFRGDNYIDPATRASAEASRAAARQAATLANARSQAAQQAQRKQANDGDWRVKLRLAPGAEYLYRDPGINSDGILWPLNVTDGVIFPYVPTINTSYHANYTNYDLTHSNYRGYFYQNSYVGEINMTAVFTAQDTKEAEYLLAVIHFFRSATKMFYGQDTPGRGSPPPLVYLQGLGEYQFNLHPCLISQFVYNLPNDVDYIRARSPNIAGTNLQIKRDRKVNPTNPFSAAIERLKSIGQPKGAINIPPAPPTLGLASPTYVPTRIEIQLTLLPTQTRQQVSQEFSLQKFANGNLLKGGFW